MLPWPLSLDALPFLLVAYLGPMWWLPIAIGSIMLFTLSVAAAFGLEWRAVFGRPPYTYRLPVWIEWFPSLLILSALIAYPALTDLQSWLVKRWLLKSLLTLTAMSF